MTINDDQIQTWFKGKPIGRDQVRAWETKRLKKNLRKFEVPMSTGKQLADHR